MFYDSILSVLLLSLLDACWLGSREVRNGGSLFYFDQFSILDRYYGPGSWGCGLHKHVILVQSKILGSEIWYSFPTLRVQFSSVTQSCPTICDPIDYSTPGFPVHHQLPELEYSFIVFPGLLSQVQWVSTCFCSLSSCKWKLLFLWEMRRLHLGRFGQWLLFHYPSQHAGDTFSGIFLIFPVRTWWGPWRKSLQEGENLLTLWPPIFGNSLTIWSYWLIWHSAVSISGKLTFLCYLPLQRHLCLLIWG